VTQARLILDGASEFASNALFMEWDKMRMRTRVSEERTMSSSDERFPRKGDGAILLGRAAPIFHLAAME